MPPPFKDDGPDNISAMVKADLNDPSMVTSSIDYVSHLKANGVKGKRIGIARNLWVTIKV